jgi:hypothetical protein
VNWLFGHFMKWIVNHSLQLKAERTMSTNRRANLQFYAGLFVLGCALLMILVQLSGWAFYQEKLRLGVAAVFLSLGTVLVALSRHRTTREGMDSRSDGK